MSSAAEGLSSIGYWPSVIELSRAVKAQGIPIAQDDERTAKEYKRLEAMFATSLITSLEFTGNSSIGRYVDTCHRIESNNNYVGVNVSMLGEGLDRSSYPMAGRIGLGSVVRTDDSGEQSASAALTLSGWIGWKETVVDVSLAYAPKHATNIEVPRLSRLLRAFHLTELIHEGKDVTGSIALGAPQLRAMASYILSGKLCGLELE